VSYLANLSLSGDAKKSWASSAGFEADEYTAAGIVATSEAGNKGFKSRAAWIALSAEYELTDRIHNEAFGIQKLLLPGVRVDVAAYLTKPEFQLIGPANIPYKVKVTKASLLVRRLEVSPQVRLAHLSMLERGANALYLTQRVETRAFEIPTGSFSLEIADVFQSSIPTLLTCIFVSTSALRGAMMENPFHLKHASLKNIEVFLGLSRSGVRFYFQCCTCRLLSLFRIAASSV